MGGLFSSSSTTNSSSGINLAQASALQNQAEGVTGNSLNDIQNLVNAGPGQSDVTNATSASQNFAQLLQQLSQQGGLPNSSQLGQAQGFAQQAFAPQTEALRQNFITQNTQAQQLAAQLGRPVNDPVIQNQLRTGFLNQQSQLGAQQGAYGSQLALQIPGMQAQYAGQGVNVLQGLATQAMQNRAALLGYGQNILGQQQQNQLARSSTWGSQTQTKDPGLAGGISGLVGAAGGALSLGNALTNSPLFGGGGNPFAGGAPSGDSTGFAPNAQFGGVVPGSPAAGGSGLFGPLAPSAGAYGAVYGPGGGSNFANLGGSYTPS